MSNGFFQSKIFSLMAVAVVFLLAFSVFRIWPQKKAVDNRLRNLQGKIAETEKSNEEISSLLNYFKSRSYLEREAKLKLNVRRPDENVVFIYKDEKEDQVKTNDPEKSLELEGVTNFEKWLKYLKSLFVTRD